MAINFGNIVLAVNRFRAPCNGGVFNVSVLVNGVENGAGGVYDVSVYDQDPFFNPDDLLAQIKNFPIAAGVGRFRIIHRFTLNCDAVCNVVGPAGTSGEQTAELYGYVRETRAFGARARSGVTKVSCIEEDDCTVAASDRTADPARRLDISAPAGAVERDTRVVIAHSVDEPETQFFADDVDNVIRGIGIGDPTLTFAKPVTVHWRLSKAEAATLKELDGSVVAFDAATSTWVRTPFRFDGAVVTFDIERGGLFGLAGHARLSRACYGALKLPPDAD